ncbi:Carcinoembryonic antigen-related cell adhesion molecule 6 [Larimichthys crocea]|uniref:Uncharacterized protein n=1 Tax=Larimichthys crocea TaxID=215358 RepID=A0ACD3QX15_LARCR|nr:Carcinoembryonic antigen-related cell adhesion molecule 6 [Larimichthys crocea]
MITVLMLLILKSGTVSASSVTFENPNPCALKGSSVEFRCSYNYSKQETVDKTTWHKGELKDGLWKRVKLSDLPSYENRTEYLGDLQHNCSLAIHDVQENDAGYYYFRFDTYTVGWRSKTSVYLSVKELSARVYPDTVRAGDTVTLECTSCQLPSVWFKDGRRVAKTEFQAQVEDAGNYACAVEGQESALSDPVALDVQYPPLSVSAEVSYSGKANSSVNLTCSSTANPPANYTWYKRTDSLSSTVQVGSGQVLSIPSVEQSHTGLYFCQARNQLGENNSTELLTVDVTDKTVNHFILLVGIGVKVVIIIMLTLVIIIWAWRWRCSSAVDKEENHNDYENIPTAHTDRHLAQV